MKFGTMACKGRCKISAEDSLKWMGLIGITYMQKTFGLSDITYAKKAQVGSLG